MKLHLPILERLIDLPSEDLNEIRGLLDDVGLEVKDIEEDEGYPVFNIETLANRGDHLHALGIAREISARVLSGIKVPKIVSQLPDKKASAGVQNSTEKCSRYYLMEMSLPENLELPEFISKVTRDSDGRHPVVDFLNYIQAEMGQPMHAFDHDKIEGDIQIVLSDSEEEIEALDGKIYKVPSESILIKDQKKIVAVGGVIGCANSMVTEETRRVLIESAAFDPVCVRLTARGMGISTDASYIFERGSDREAILFSLKRLAYLTSGSGGSVSGSEAGHVLGLSGVAGPETEQREVSLSLSTIRREMNLPRMKQVEVKSRLQNLGYRVREDGEDMILTVPSWRLWDVEYDADLVEDFVRSHGFNNVKLKLPPLDYEEAVLNETEILLDKLEPVLLGSGFFEVITDTFYSQEYVDILSERSPGIDDEHVKIMNAIESSCSHIKATNILHLAQLANLNLRKGGSSFKVYEFGRLYGVSGSNAAKDPDETTENLYERDVLTLGVAGRWHRNAFQLPGSTADKLYQFKGLLEALILALGSAMSVSESKNPFLHPGQQATLKAGRSIIGFFGTVHPAILNRLGMKEEVLYAEFDAAALIKAQTVKELVPPIEYPSVKKDLTLKVATDGQAGKMLPLIAGAQVPNLQGVTVVDEFKKDDEDFRRVSYRLTFQDSSRTLEHTEVDTAIKEVIRKLKEDHGVDLAG